MSDEDLELEIEEQTVHRAHALRSQKNTGKPRSSYGVEASGEDFVDFFKSSMRWGIIAVLGTILFALIVIADFEQPGENNNGQQSNQPAQLAGR